MLGFAKQAVLAGPLMLHFQCLFFGYKYLTAAQPHYRSCLYLALKNLLQRH